MEEHVRAAGHPAIGALTFAAIMPESLINDLANKQLISFSSSVLVCEYDHGEHGHIAGVDTVRPHLRSPALILNLIDSSSHLSITSCLRMLAISASASCSLARALVEYRSRNPLLDCS